MDFKTFLNFVEIRTKLASVIPFIFGSLYALYRDDIFDFDILNFVIMFVSLLFIDMTTTAINNYMDFKKAKVDEYKEKENIIGYGNVDLKVARNIIFSMLGVAIVSGLILCYRTDVAILILGGISFVIGILYTYGPTPISRTPYGEVVSGVTMGFVILFIATYIHSIEEIVAFNKNFVYISFDYYVVMGLLLISIPFIMAIANVMLANNICDLEMDKLNERFLLPYYIGKERAVKIFEINYYVGYIAIIVSVAIGVLPYSVLLTLITFIVVRKHINVFKEKQIKSETFIFAVKNLLIIGMGYNISLLIGVVASYYK